MLDARTIYAAPSGASDYRFSTLPPSSTRIPLFPDFTPQLCLHIILIRIQPTNTPPSIRRVDESQLRAQVSVLMNVQAFRHQVCRILLRSNVSECCFIRGHSFANKMVSNVDVFCACVIRCVMRDRDRAQVVRANRRWLLLVNPKVLEESPYPYHPSVNEIYSVSVVDNATVRCFLEVHAIAPPLAQLW